MTHHLQGVWPQGSSASPYGLPMYHAPLVPLIDLWETKNELIVTLDIAGAEPENINVNLEHGQLTVTGEIISADVTGTSQPLYQERPKGQFGRSITLPLKVNNENVVANYRNGLLEIRCSKISDGKQRVQVNPEVNI